MSSFELRATSMAEHPASEPCVRHQSAQTQQHFELRGPLTRQTHSRWEQVLVLRQATATARRGERGGRGWVRGWW
jgi:hypothetical protein